MQTMASVGTLQLDSKLTVRSVARLAFLYVQWMFSKFGVMGILNHLFCTKVFDLTAQVPFPIDLEVHGSTDNGSWHFLIVELVNYVVSV